jgi:uncharacterized protein YfaS (alpha-2-macroglobulin family)
MNFHYWRKEPMNVKQLFTVGFVCWCFLLFSCSEDKPAPSGDRTEVVPVVAHTSGSIARAGKITVRFAKDIVDPDRIEIPLEKSPITFNPRIKGAASWINRRTLEFIPDESLPAGQNYAATVYLSEIMETVRPDDTFDFKFSIMEQSFEITIEGLQAASPKDSKIQQLSGVVVTADAEQNAALENILKAYQLDKDLKIEWRHSEDKREHKFIISGILREEEFAAVVLQWDGTPIGVKKKGKKIVSVPSIMAFEVSFARAVQGKEQYIEVRFSDPLDKQQNLKGLIRVENRRDLKFTIQGSIVKIYSSRRWSGSPTVKVSAGIRSAVGQRLKKSEALKVYFADVKPQVRFAGKGVIVPTTRGLTIPVEAVNLRAVKVVAERIFEENIHQFLQVNPLNGQAELKRVGRNVWRKTVTLDWSLTKRNRWVRYGLDVAPLVKENPGGIYRITLSFTPRHIVYECAASPTSPDGAATDMAQQDLDEEEESSYWDTYEQNADYNWHEYYENRHNPCHPAYYRQIGTHNITVSRNVLVSDIGLIAKKGSNDEVFVAATDIQTAEPLADIALKLLDYQRQTIAEGKSDSNGIALLSAKRKPFLLVAKNRHQTGYLKLDDGSALSVSHFDVAGHTVKKGLKGFIYGERGVWRPGDPIYLTFILLDEDNRLPDDHPVKFELLNPKGQRVQTLTRKQSLNGFYSFHTATEPGAPTGNWRVRVKVGGVSFEKILKVETIMPNRLKISLDFGPQTPSLTEGLLDADLSAVWLHGAIAKNLKFDVELTFTPRKTIFPKYESYAFDDPVRKFQPESHKILEGVLDSQGKTEISADIRAEGRSPGMLTANFLTRVFEPSGAFSIDRFPVPYHPYDRYVGLATPKGDKARGMLLTDTDHLTRIVLLDPSGNPVPAGQVEIKMYKIKWRWWWEKGEESLADYIGTSAYKPLKSDTVQIVDGKGEWKFRINYPAWGRYLIRVHDRNSNHITGKILYIDWPGWAGRAQKDAPGGASVLNFSADKEAYTVGDKVVLTIPTGKTGRGLVSIESGSKILKTAWITGGAEPTRFEFPATAEMTPNVYAHVTFLQPHLQAGNDLPIRMYGVIPVKITDPDTRLKPQLVTPDVFKPEEKSEITISEVGGKSMTYTVAIVDEGLLDLTRFPTPDPWQHFYKREALGVKTWDLFDNVAGAWGGKLEKLLAIGGDDAAEPPGQKKADRFPPMVRFLGPFELDENQKKTHEIDIPQYVGSVRLMVVAGNNKAFGTVEKSVFVRKPLMILGTLPRVLGPDEEVDLPISVFALEDKVKKVAVEVSTEGPLDIQGSARKTLGFTEIGDQLITFKLKAQSELGIGSVSILASGGGEKAAHRIELDIRMPGGKVVDVHSAEVAAGKTWQQEIALPGIAGTNDVMLEVSRIPPLNLGKRLAFLIRYPHGCVEQVTSSVFPQLYLDKLLELSPKKQDAIQNNVQAGIGRLRNFQTADGGFAYWPGYGHGDDWASNYAGHFLLEAARIGYLIPPGIIEQWRQYQLKKALSWVTGPARSELIQAYRLYTLALAGAADLGAMNRLKEEEDLPDVARWRLAAAYQLAGQPEAAEQLVKTAKLTVVEYRELSNTYGSDLRDKAMILESLYLMNQMKRAKPLAEEIAGELSGDKWLSTQTTAYALIALSRMAGIAGRAVQTSFIYSWGQSAEKTVSSHFPIMQKPIIVAESTTGKIILKNTSDHVLYPRIIAEGFPAVGTEKAASNGMSLKVKYLTLDDDPIDPTSLEQGVDFIAEVMVRNTGTSGIYEEVALSHIVASGWEIRSSRMDPSQRVKSADFEYQDIRDDRVYTYFDLGPGELKIYRLLFNASYLGKFYLPSIGVEAMYDATINARIPGKWTVVVPPGAGGEKEQALEEPSGIHEIEVPQDEPQTESLGIIDDQA